MIRVTLAEKTAEQLLTYIQKNGLRPGDRLPTETELSQALGVGRNTLREAQKILASRNVITIRQGSGSYISEKAGIPDDPLGFALVQDKARLTRDLLQIRSILEPSIAALAAQNRTEEDLKELGEILDQIEKKISRRENFMKEDVKFHSRIAACTHNQVMSELIPIIAGGVEVFAGTVSTPEYDQTLRSHREIYDAIRDRRGSDAENAMRYHILFNQYRFQVGAMK